MSAHGHPSPERRARMREMARIRWEKPNARQRAAETARAIWQKPGFREYMSEAISALWQKPGSRERMMAGVNKVSPPWPPERTAALLALLESRPPDGTLGRSFGVLARTLSSKFGVPISPAAVRRKARRLGLEKAGSSNSEER